jgi:hypothetical protein
MTPYGESQGPFATIQLVKIFLAQTLIVRLINNEVKT